METRLPPLGSWLRHVHSYMGTDGAGWRLWKLPPILGEFQALIHGFQRTGWVLGLLRRMGCASITLVTAKDALSKPPGLASQLDQASGRMRLEVNHSQPQAVGGLHLRAVAPACESVSNAPRGESRDIYLKGGLEGKSLNWVTAGRIRRNTHFYLGCRNIGGTNDHASYLIPGQVLNQGLISLGTVTRNN